LTDGLVQGERAPEKEWLPSPLAWN